MRAGLSSRSVSALSTEWGSECVSVLSSGSVRPPHAMLDAGVVNFSFSSVEYGVSGKFTVLVST